MNKTYNINLAGQIFAINDDAYESLSAYLQSLRQFYKNEIDRDEIIKDIESRFAELFLAKGKGYIVTKKDTDEVIGMMGRPQEFDTSYTEDDIEIEPNKTPYQNAGYETKKRVYRDPDDKIVAGVCSGLAKYFGIDDPIWFRIGFVLITLFTGLGFLVYPILWLIIPEATTSSQKLTMRGENVNLSSIEKTVREEPVQRQGAGNQILEFIGGFIKLFFKSLLYLGVFVLGIVALAIIISLLATFFGLGIALVAGNPLLTKYFFDNNSVSWLIGIGGLLATVIPIILFVLAIVHIFSKTNKPLKKNILFSLIGLFLFGILLLNIVYSKGKKLIAEHQKITQSVPLYEASKIDTLDLSMAFTEKKDNIDGVQINSFQDFMNFIARKDEINIPVDIKILPTNSDSFIVVREFSANGKDEKTALENATDITHNIIQKGNQLIIDPYIGIDIPKSKFRNQKLIVKIYVPEGKKIKWNERVEDFMDEDKLDINWSNAGNHTNEISNLKIQLNTLKDSTNINIHIDSNNPDLQEAIQEVQDQLNDKQDELNDKLDDLIDAKISGEHYLFKMHNGELFPLD